MKTKEDFMLLFKDAIETESVIDESTIFRELDEWDSLANLSVIAMLDEEYGVVIEGEEFSSLTTVGDIWTRLRK